MTVVVSGSFSMFGTSNRTIQGAIVQGGGSASSDTTFTQLISHSTVSKFHPTYAGNITNLNQISEATQYRGYPHGGSAATSYNYYIASPRLKSATSGSYFTSPGYNMSYRLTSTEQSLDNLGGDTLIDPATGSGYVGQSPNDIVNNDGYLYAISVTQNENTLDSGYNDRFVTINSSGVVIDVGNITSNNGVILL
tara:strand:- start:67 stop:648 length:582 start_codon:yes stop_codon:yes gene_type:complete